MVNGAHQKHISINISKHQDIKNTNILYQQIYHSLYNIKSDKFFKF
jgi:hypothetical protein